MKNQHGFSLTSLIVALLIAAILTVFATPMFGSAKPNCDNLNARQGPLVRARIAQVTGDIGRIHMAADMFELSNQRYPNNLAELGLDHLRDPWGNPYRYLLVYGRKDLGPVRKDHDLKPINTSYDLYSTGPDGATASPLTSTGGQDDIVMANDGDYFGLACLYNGSGKN